MRLHSDWQGSPTPFLEYVPPKKTALEPRYHSIARDSHARLHVDIPFRLRQCARSRFAERLTRWCFIFCSRIDTSIPLALLRDVLASLFLCDQAVITLFINVHCPRLSIPLIFLLTQVIFRHSVLGCKGAV